MLTLRKIAVTGGLSSGKSSVCRLMKSFGAYTVSADEIVHQLLSPHTELGKQIVTIFGQDILKGDHFDRSEIAKRAFGNLDKLHQLEALLHPAVLKEVEHQYKTLLTSTPFPLFVAEIPLLFEIKAERWFDQVVVVVASDSLCRNRFKASSNQSDDQFFLRTQRQLPIEEKMQKADYLIKNNGSLEDLKNQVKILYQTLITN
ncbi:MAG: dephospho-CoA kinase [Simkania sp.]|nr:dephospho-CoA kinase [Simkania sp.]